MQEFLDNVSSKRTLRKAEKAEVIASELQIARIKEEVADDKKRKKERDEEDVVRQKYTLSGEEAMLEYSEDLEEQAKAWGEKLEIIIDPVQLGVDTGGFAGGDWGAGGSFGVDSVAIVSAIDQQTIEIITGLGTHSPQSGPVPTDGPVSSSLLSTDTTGTQLGVDKTPADETPALGVDKTPALGVDKIPALGVDKIPALGVDKIPAIAKDDDAPLEEVFDKLTPDADIARKFYEAGTTKGSIYVHDINVEKETNVQLSPMKSALAELADMGRDDLAFDARREKREIKADGRALEDRRDTRGKGQADGADSPGSPGSPGSPTLNKEGGGFFKGILTSGKSKMLKMAAGFGKMLLPLLGFAAVTAVLAGGGILLSNWVKKNYGAEADKTFTDIEDKNPEFAAHIKKITGGAGTLTAAAGGVAGVLQDLAGVEDALENAVGGAIELQNDWLENWTGDLTSGVLTAVRRTGELQEETQLAANQIFRNGIDDVTGQLERGELGEKGLGELQGIIQQSMATLSGGTNWIAEQFGIENLTGMWELGKEDQIKILALLKEQMLENDVELKKTVAEARDTDIRVIQQNNPALAEKIAVAQGEVVAREKQKEDTTEVEEDRIKVLQKRFRELTFIQGDAGGYATAGSLKGADQEKTRAALQAMLEKNEMTSEELLLLIKSKGVLGYSQEQKNLMAKMAIQKGIVKSQYGTTETEFGMGGAYRKQKDLAEQKKLELEKVEKTKKENLAKKAADTGAVDLGLGNARKWLATFGDLKKLSELDLGSLEALLDTEKWSKKDEETIKNIVAAKKAGASIDFKKGGLFSSDKLEFGEAGSAKSTTVQGVDTSGAGVVTGDQPKPTMMEASDRLEKALDAAYMKSDTMDAGTQEYANLMNEIARLERDLDELDMMSAEEFNALTPDSAIMDSFYKAGTTKGSIYVHDINVEKAINSALGIELGKAEAIESDLQSINAPGIELGKAEAIESDWLDKLKVTAGEWAEKAASSLGQAPPMVNAPTTIDQSSKQSVNVGSSAHAPAQPLGSGYMGVSTPRG